MDLSLVYVKTQVGDEAVRQSTRVVQRNLRMVLLQVDGNLSVRELIAKIGNQSLVEGALKELEEGGLITVSAEAQAARADKRSRPTGERLSAISQFSTFGSQSAAPASRPPITRASGFSSFGKPVFSLAPSEAPPLDIDTRGQQPPQYRAGRQVPVRRWLFGGAAFLLVVLVGVALFYPYATFRPAIEASLSRLLATPVKVGDVRVELVPRPSLKLTDVQVGDTGDSRIASIAVGSPYMFLGEAPYRIAEVELSGVSLTANRLVDLPLFGAPPGTGELSVRRLVVDGAILGMGDLKSPEFAGEILLRPDGTAEKASFRAADGGLRINAKPSDQGVLLDIEGVGWKPEGKPFAFESLQAKGVLQKNRLLIEKVDTTFLGGILRGNWLIDWSAGMVMAGEATVSRLDGRKVSAVFAPALRLEGEVSGALRMRSTGAAWQEMLGRIEANLDAEVGRGMLTGVDLGEVVRRGQGAVVRSGSTRFDTLQAHLDIAKGRVVARSMQLDAGPMTASGRVTVEPGGQLDGALTIVASSSVSSRRVTARVGGSLSDMVLTTGN